MQTACVRVLAPLLLPGSLCGCVIPIPHPESAVAGSRPMLAAADAAFIRPGHTTREEVLLRLGEPEMRWHDDRVMVYGWTSSNLFIVIIVGGPYGAGGATGGDAPIANFLLVEFDAANRVRRYEFKDAPPFTRGDVYARQLRSGW